MSETKGLNKNATRMLTGFIMGTIAMGCIMLGGVALLCLLAVVIFFASKEYVKILEHKGFYPSLKIMLASEALLAIITYFDRTEYVALALTLCTFAAFMWVLFRGRQPYIANVSTTILGFVYCGYFPLHLQLLRDISSEQYHDGLGFVVMMFVAILLTDVGCYYAGTRFGKHKLAPVISPNKTIEGSVGGAVSAITGALIVGYFIGVEWYLSVVAGLICTAFAQIGDLCESLIKRDAGVKDSGNSLPGHGGFLDRTDSFVFTIPVMFYFCKYFIFSNDIMNYLKGLF
ncbi:phosphatidate cytidylyltransferase [Clostridium sp. CAG:967]|nr:phosphatidate cytidylyltransferase [Clostridium sp. CAG:967]